MTLNNCNLGTFENPILLDNDSDDDTFVDIRSNDGDENDGYFEKTSISAIPSGKRIFFFFCYD